MTQIRVTPDNRINVVETKGEIASRLRDPNTINVLNRFITLSQITSSGSWDKETEKVVFRDVKEEILINIDHIISIYL